ncbi:hypothetical protein ERO13_A10G225600v2 [Gossypium hirsutum]|uniref:Uncharacterized protein n=4 Tax=Gossypium TaxID=3633 RepID=A0A5J5U824_GOSBA|nr:hypothetical protein ES319_A10G251600v1 [Gossypium barbadense]KAG4181409.1 hypothetical protein ERO13_A10G225600v2 [Gossypium hirsutum]TYH00454.1 hypothetical protein ES288_A10G278100v1 [Gossypium darwinii]TYI08091.1 hypothetical protein ES332_A10G273300v1 [Gossypium tomentosum]TYJ16412.1 hypothetical protein E1A91_A10G251500v1 [Gossypium mustelinum]
MATLQRTAVRRSDLGDVETKRQKFLREADPLVPFWFTPEASSIHQELKQLWVYWASNFGLI